MKATVAAVLLHSEADQRADVHGALREPMLKLMHVLRSLGYTIPVTSRPYGVLVLYCVVPHRTVFCFKARARAKVAPPLEF